MIIQHLLDDIYHTKIQSQYLAIEVSVRKIPDELTPIHAKYLLNTPQHQPVRSTNMLQYGFPCVSWKYDCICMCNIIILRAFVFGEIILYLLRKGVFVPYKNESTGNIYTYLCTTDHTLHVIMMTHKRYIVIYLSEYNKDLT